MKIEPIKYRLENAIRRKWGQRGHWKQQIVMVLSYELGSLSKAWEEFRYVYGQIDLIRHLRASKNNVLTFEEEINLITKGMHESKEPICTLDV